MALKPIITGTTAGQRSVDEAPVAPFSEVTITDPNRGRNTLTIALVGPGGTLAGDGLTAADDGTYTLSGTAAQVTARLRALTFTPAAGQPGSEATTRFRLTDRSGAAPSAPAVDNATTVIDDDTPTAPAAPRLTAATDTGTSQDDGVTEDAAPTVTGKARPGATVTIYAGDAVLGQGKAAGDGVYAIAVSRLAEGANAVAATQTAHGLTSARGPSRRITLDTAAPTVRALKVRGPGIDADGGGDLGPGRRATFTLRASEPVFVDGGVPSLSLNDGGAASYTGGSGTGVLTFSYTVATGENTDALAVTGLSNGGAAITDKAGNALDAASLASADRPVGTLVVDTAAPTVAIANEGGPTGNPNVTLRGTVAGADRKTRVSIFDDGSAKALATAKVKADGSFNVPIQLRAGTNVLSVVGTDGAGNRSRPAEVAYVDVPDTVSLDQAVTYRNGVFTLTGTASSVSGVKQVSIYADVAGKVKDLGNAAVSPDGTFVFRDAIRSDVQGFFSARLVDGAGAQTRSADPLFSLTGGLGLYGKGGRQTVYAAGGDVVRSASLFQPNGQRSTSVEAPDGAVDLRPYDSVFAHRQGHTAFVYAPSEVGGAVAAVHGFKLGGADHDTLELPSGDFTGFADVLRHTGDVNGSAFVTDPNTGDAVRLAGVTTAALKAHPRDTALV